MKDSIELYIEHPTDWEQSEYVIVDYFISWDGDKLDDLGIDKWHPVDLAEWITEDLVYNELFNQIKKQNEQSN
ncbi:hypothetical protein UFOVP1384_29 [uncultured Caudovirales phage]|uniref:Uncharacterized protein n=1 Tax=uncultured Caudovirales phage TaxID=2100421 RepID=A0A6J5S6N2_9CAUD|nr:hypothetical protein UFOVP1384_29 [uncultured Caudovirales phage]